MGVDEYLTRKGIRSQRTQGTYRTALNVWGSSLTDPINAVIGRLKSGGMDPYDELNRFIAFCTKRGLAPKTLAVYVSAVKDFWINEDVPLDAFKLRKKVTMPASYEVSTDRSPTHEEVKRIMIHSSLPAKVATSILTSSGMRVGELATLKIGDVEFGNPTKIRVKARTTKTKKSRLTFISNEAAEYLKEYLGSRISQKDELIFTVRGDKPSDSSNLYHLIMTRVDQAGLKGKMDDDSRRYAIHPHSLRKYFFTNALASGIERGIVEGFMGHKFGLDGAYLRLSEDELGQEYLKAADRFNFLTGNGNQLRGRVEELEEENKRLRSEVETLKSGTVTTEALQEIQKQINEAIAEGFRSGKIPKIKIEVKKRLLSDNQNPS